MLIMVIQLLANTHAQTHTQTLSLSHTHTQTIHVHGPFDFLHCHLFTIQRPLGRYSPCEGEQ